MILAAARELNYLFRPYIDMYLFHILDAWVMGRDASRQFMTIGAILFLLSLFFAPENRSGAALYGRVAFVAIIAVLVYLDRQKTPEEPAKI